MQASPGQASLSRLSSSTLNTRSSMTRLATGELPPWVDATPGRQCILLHLALFQAGYDCLQSHWLRCMPMCADPLAGEDRQHTDRFGFITPGPTGEMGVEDDLKEAQRLRKWRAMRGKPC